MRNHRLDMYLANEEEDLVRDDPKLTPEQKREGIRKAQDRYDAARFQYEKFGPRRAR
jgi:iron uptake system EfeUOB component EfeO/EfeM